jgi:hypothetical protein
LQVAGKRFTHERHDELWLPREARPADPSVSIICSYKMGADRLDPPWRILD